MVNGHPEVKCVAPPGLNDPLEQRKLFLERAKLFREHIQNVLTLATGALVLSITFLHDIAPNPVDRGSLRIAWKLLVLAVLWGVAYNYVLAIYTRNESKPFGYLLAAISVVFHAFFIVALYYLMRFGLANL